MSDYLARRGGYPPNPHADRYRHRIGTERSWTGNGEPVFEQPIVVSPDLENDLLSRRTVWFQAVEKRLHIIRTRTGRRRLLRARVRQTYRTMGRT